MLAGALAIAAALSGCATTTVTAPASDPRLSGEWELTSATDAAGALDMPGPPITLTISAAAPPHGRGPCNDYDARIIGTTGPVFVTVTGRTTGLCNEPQLRTVEYRYLKDLDATTLATVDNGLLTLASGKTRLTYNAAATVRTSLITGKTWHITALSLADEYYNELRPAPDHLDLRLDKDSTFTVTTPCSPVTGSWTVDAGEIVMTDMHMPATPCPISDFVDRATVVMVLSHGFIPQPFGGTLILTNPRAEGALLMSDTTVSEFAASHF
jgi:heat shock protein HslJ